MHSRKKRSFPVFWDLFMEKVREKAIASPNPEERSFWAEKLVELSKTKSETGKRNLVTSIQTPAVFS
jgi:hypothetical protein